MLSQNFNVPKVKAHTVNRGISLCTDDIKKIITNLSVRGLSLQNPLCFLFTTGPSVRACLLKKSTYPAPLQPPGLCQSLSTWRIKEATSGAELHGLLECVLWLESFSAGRKMITHLFWSSISGSNNAKATVFVCSTAGCVLYFPAL